MPKAKTLWYCSSCGNESSKWMGQCPACKEWNTMVEAPVRAAAGGSGSSRVGAFGTTERQRPVRLQDVDARADERVSLCNGEVDRLLGGGIVPGSLVLIGGEPGIGKSTLSLLIPLHCPSLRTL